MAVTDKHAGRRNFLKQSGGAALGVAALATGINVEAAYKSRKVVSVKELRPNTPVSFNYPDNAAAVILDMGQAVEGGIGPKKSIVAFSALCQHMGCPVNYVADDKQFVCPCHASAFDPLRNGDAVEGPSTRGLPRIALKISNGDILATGIVSGVVYGYSCNNA